jgi:short-subunit dehydrogenase
MADFLKPLDQQVMVITGASSGIGLCTAIMAAEAGARLVLVARSLDVLDDLTRELNAAGAKAVAVAADVARRDELQRAAEAAVDNFGRIDTWVNNAGLSIYGRLDAVSEADSRRLFDVNFWGVVNGSLVALPHLRDHGGALINLGNEVSEAVIGLQGMYSASKHAVKGFTDALRVEVEDIDKAPVSITLIQPTAVDTPFPQHAKNYMEREPKLPTPMIDPERVAQAILEAATTGGRDVKVGAMAVLNTATARLMPALGDKFSARQTVRQQHPVSPQDPDGSLYRPSHDGHIHGHFNPGTRH